MAEQLFVRLLEHNNWANHQIIQDGWSYGEVAGALRPHQEDI